MMGRRRPRTSLERQAMSRKAIRDAVEFYAALRGAAGEYVDTVPVKLRDGTRVVALIRVDLIPDASVDPTVVGPEA